MPSLLSSSYGDITQPCLHPISLCNDKCKVLDALHESVSVSSNQNLLLGVSSLYGNMPLLPASEFVHIHLLHYPINKEIDGIFSGVKS